ncbi:MAG: aspartyl protease family protein [Lysobacter sp.]
MTSATTTNGSLRRALVAALAVLALAMPLSRPVAASERPTQVDALLSAAKAGDLASLEAGLKAIADPALVALAQARLAASRLDTATADRQLERYWADDRRDRAHDGEAWSIAADIAFADGDYAGAAAATRRWAALLAKADPREEAAGVAQFHGIASLLAAAPRQAIVKRDPRRIATRRDKAGLLRASVTINDGGQDAVLDTGANLSVVSASTADRLGLRILDGAGSVGSGSREQVATRLGIADRFEIAGVTLSNVVFLVLDDAQLEMPLPGGYRIDAIIGFPVLRAIGRMRFGADGSFTPQAASSATGPALDNLHVVGNDLFVELSVGGMPVALHLDTGAPASLLSTRFVQRHPEVPEGLERRKQRNAGAGGTTTQDTAIWKDVRVDIGNHAVTLPELAIAVSDSMDVETRTFGILGLDVIGAFDAYTVDLDAMSFEVERASAPSSL